MKFPKQILGILTLVAFLSAQNLTVPRASNMATVSQTIGISKVEINYSRPNVNNREIWGKLVPYGLTKAFNGNMIPWRAGANENTTIHFSHDVKIEGKSLKAGTYGLHMIPGKDQFEVVFSSDNKAWGSFNYVPNNNALVVKVKPETSLHQESLAYQFDHVSTSKATFALVWEKLRVPVNVEFNTPEIVVANFQQELKGRAGFNAQSFAQAAQYCINNDIKLGQAEKWLNRSIIQAKGFTNVFALSRLHAKKGASKKSKKSLDEAIELGTEAELNRAGYQMLGAKNMKMAFMLFKANVKKNPNSWNVYDSLAECYQTSGDKSKAKEHYTMALSKLPATDNANKTRIQNILNSL